MLRVPPPVALVALIACGGSVDGGGGQIKDTDPNDYSHAAPPATHDETSPTPPSTAVPATDARPKLPNPLIVLPLGDSITQGNTSHDSYRRTLWRKMDALGLQFDFVGSNTGNNGGAPPHDDFDTDNEGHWAARADEVLANLPGYLNSYTPDVVLLHLGSNDAFQGKSVQTTIASLKGIIETLRRKNPSVVILLAKLIPPVDAGDAKAVMAINNALPSFVTNVQSDAAPVILVDQASGFDPSELTFDGVHPNSAGEDRMAAIWLDAITDLGTQD